MTLELFFQYLAIFSASIFKFIAGPILGMTTGTDSWITALLTAGGMMTGVIAITLAGKPMRTLINKKFFSRRKKFTAKNRRFVKLWGSYGVFGVSFLTPVILSPIGGSLLVASMGGKTSRILLWMSLSAIFWGVIFSQGIFLFAEYFKS
jgi:hypothetical protein